jgi:two-component system alkaline phosphatase synthesis response regulator PhoP
MGKKIAIIEDDPAISEMYKIKFATSGYDVVTAENGQQGLLLIEKEKPSIVLLDLMMPVMSGDEMLKILRGTPWGKNIKVIILTNIAAEEAAKGLTDYGVSGYILKAHTTPHQVLDYVQKVED